MMYALFLDGAFVRTQDHDARPDPNPAKGYAWYPVGAPVEGEPAGWAIVDDEAIETVVPAPVADPTDTPLTPVQFFAMLDILGIRAAIETAIDAIADDIQRAVARAKFERSASYHRDDALIAQIAPLVGISDAAIDTAWAQAQEIG
ncbi:MAG: hypothetical protein KDJ90_00335 [Nitratireductor sp.]|nr:hypothetical protein [Nitratireductor sp.]